MEKQRKTIQINPNFFNIGKKTKTKKKMRPDLSKTIKPNNLKKQLLAKIKSHQQNHKEQSAEKEDVQEFQTNFKSSLNYLQTMIKQKKEKKQLHKKTRKRPSNNILINPHPFNENNENNENNEHKIQPRLVDTADLKYLPPPLMPPPQSSMVSPPQSSMVSPPQSLMSPSSIQIPTRIPSPAQPYGCLKNGKKPTYSQYVKTLKKRVVDKPKLTLPPRDSPSQEIKDRKDKLNKLRENMVVPKKVPILTTINKKRTIKIFKLGKKDGKVGVLIKSGKTRKKIREEQQIIHIKAMADIKYYLRKHNLIKAGTSAPENVLRKLYEDSFLSGDIYNNNADVLIHNYMQDEDIYDR